MVPLNKISFYTSAWVVLGTVTLMQREWHEYSTEIVLCDNQKYVIITVIIIIIIVIISVL